MLKISRVFTETWKLTLKVFFRIGMTILVPIVPSLFHMSFYSHISHIIRISHTKFILENGVHRELFFMKMSVCLNLNYTFNGIHMKIPARFIFKSTH